jgi:hypothetical protein
MRNISYKDEGTRKESYQIRGGYVPPMKPGFVRAGGYANRRESYRIEYTPQREEYKGKVGFRGSYSGGSGGGGGRMLPASVSMPRLSRR